MGVHYLSRHNEHMHARLPLKITFNTDPQLETDLYFLKDYQQIGCGTLKSIGIDGSVFIHSHIIAESAQTPDGKKLYNVCIDKSASQISTKIFEYVNIVLHFFEIMNHPHHPRNNESSDNILIHVVIDGKPPASKNRRSHTPDAYSQMNKTDKKKLHRELIDELKKQIKKFNENITTNMKLILLSNDTKKNRGEGELELFSVCKKINERYETRNDVKIKNVIISSDSDVIALMALHRDERLVIISPTCNGIYITNLQLMLKGLQLNHDEFIKYVVLHFIFFGSDYNAGLMTTATESKQLVIYNAVKKGCDDINEIGRGCLRKMSKRAKERLVVTPSQYLDNLKEDLMIEAICSVQYYKSLGNTDHLINFSPFIYQKPDSRECIPLISF